MLKTFINSFCLAISKAYKEYEISPGLCSDGDIYFGKSKCGEIVCEFLVSPENPNANLIIRGSLLSEMFRVYTESNEPESVATTCTYLIPRIIHLINEHNASSSPELTQLRKEFERAMLNGILEQVKNADDPDASTN